MAQAFTAQPPTGAPASQRVFLFLQGPHGPFFHGLAQMLRQAGAQAWRVGFNAGDRAFWFHGASYIAHRGAPQDWPMHLAQIVAEKAVTDLVLYGDTRFVHASAIAFARENNLCVHVFEEGYLRPYWVTYERGGTNGNSRLMHTSVAEMRRALTHADTTTNAPPARWGDMRQHVFYGALYHWFVMFKNGGYRQFQPHRQLPVSAEFMLYLRRLVMMPFHSLQRRLATARIRRGGFPYHLVLLQLEHDSSFQVHSPFADMHAFIELVIAGFAAGAPRHHHLVFKAHPLETGRAPLRADIARLAQAHGVGGRVHFLQGGKLAQLLNEARSAVTVNSTAAQQVLWRGIPLKVFGAAIYNKPEFVSTQSLAQFFTAPTRPDRTAYQDFRAYLLETSQIPGGFYSSHGRRQVLRQVVDMMLSPDDPYDALHTGRAGPRQYLQMLP